MSPAEVCRRVKSHSSPALVSGVLALSIVWASDAFAETPRERAAKAFDEGVQLYDRAAYPEAARAFLRADGAMPSADALQNALSAAKKSNDHMLVVEVAQRALAREATEPALAVKGRQALSEASVHIATLELKCEPTPCTIEIDGADTPAGTRYVLPGLHTISASGESNSRAKERMTLEAGNRYEITLPLTKPGEATQPAKVEKTEAKKEAGPGGPHDSAKRKPLSPAVFYVGVGATVVLAGLMTWSGIDTLKAKSDLPATDAPNYTDERDRVLGKVHRTDFLLAGTVVVGALTGYAGFALVDFGDKEKSAALVISPASRSLIVKGHF